MFTIVEQGNFTAGVWELFGSFFNKTIEKTFNLALASQCRQYPAVKGRTPDNPACRGIVSSGNQLL